MIRWERNRRAQAVAKDVLHILGNTLTPTDTEASIALRANALLAERGVTETWYYDCPVFVLLGSRSCASLSGREYTPANEPIGHLNLITPANEPIGHLNLITVDLSPSLGGAWGDCARSFFVESGRFVSDPTQKEFQAGFQMELKLHEEMLKFVTLETTFEELHQFSNDQIVAAGFENLDFMGNLGHSIGAEMGDRVYIEKGNSARLSEVGLFTFEPHIREVGSKWGFKHENIYYFDENGDATEL